MRIIGVAGLALLAACGQPPAEMPSPATDVFPARVEEVRPGSAIPAPPPVTITPEVKLPSAPEDGITVEGWGAIRIGMTLDALNAAAGETFDPTADPDFAEYECTFFYPKSAPDGLSVMYVRGRVARIDVHKPGVATYGGLQVGDTSTKAREALGAALNSQPHFYVGLPAEYLTVWTSGGPRLSYATGMPTDELAAAMLAARGLRFETDDKGVIEEFRAGDSAIELPEGCL